MNVSPVTLSAALMLALVTTATGQQVPPSASPVPVNQATETRPLPSVLDRFKTFSGKRVPAEMLRMFSLPELAGIVSQSPQVALSNGSSTVRLKVTVKGAPATAPNFAFINARQVSNVRSGPETWQIELIPDAGSWSCSVIVQNGATTIEIPVTVAPSVAAERDVSLPAFEAYLNSGAGSPLPQHDLNDDGRNDYLDDYMFTANFLARKQSDPHDPASRNQRARELTPIRTKP